MRSKKNVRRLHKSRKHLVQKRNRRPKHTRRGKRSKLGRRSRKARGLLSKICSQGACPSPSPSPRSKLLQQAEESRRQIEEISRQAQTLRKKNETVNRMLGNTNNKSIVSQRRKGRFLVEKQQLILLQNQLKKRNDSLHEFILRKEPMLSRLQESIDSTKELIDTVKDPNRKNKLMEENMEKEEQLTRYTDIINKYRDEMIENKLRFDTEKKKLQRKYRR